MVPGRLDRLIEKGFWLLLTGIATFMANEVHSLTSSVQELNIKMAAVVQKMSDQDERIRALEARRR